MGSDCEQRRSPALTVPSSKESLSPEAAAGAQERAGHAAVAEAVAPAGEPSDPKVDAARLRAAMGDRDERTYAILQNPLRARMVAAAAAYGPSFSADVAETIGNAKDYEVVRSFLVGSIDPVVELGFRAGLLSLDGEGVLQTIRDLTPAQLARFAEDPASRQAYEDKLVEIVGWVHLDILDEEEIWNRVFDDAFDLWRHAKPHKTDWPTPFAMAPIPEWQHPRWLRNPRCTELVGIDAAGEAEFSAFVPPGKHLTPPDYGVLRGHADWKQDANGDPVTGARVVFPFLDMAIPERRPLFDVGAKVYYVGANGELVPVPEEG